MRRGRDKNMAVATETWNTANPLTRFASRSWISSQTARNGLAAVALTMPPCLFGAVGGVQSTNGEGECSVSQTNIPVNTMLGTTSCGFDRHSILAQLDRLKDLPKGWNGYGAQKIDEITIEAAMQFVNDIPKDAIATPLVVPMTGGRLQFEWHRGNRSLQFEFKDPRRIQYLKADDDVGIEEESSLFVWQAYEILRLLHWFSAE